MLTLEAPTYPSYSFDPAKEGMTPSDKAKARRAHNQALRVVSDVAEAMRTLDDERWLSFDLETSGLNPRRDRVAVVALYGPERNVAGVLHFAGRDISPELIRWLEGKALVGHNVTRFDQLFMRSYGMDTRKAEWYDTLLGEQVASASQRKGVSNALKPLLARRLNVEIPKDIDHGTWMLPTLTDEQLRYIADDIYYVPRLMQDQWRRAAEADEKYQFEGELGVRDALLFEQSLAPVFNVMMARGLPINVPALVDYTQTMVAAVPEHEAWLQTHLGPAWLELYPKDPAILLGSYTKLPHVINTVYGTKLQDTKADTLKMLRQGDGELAELAERMLRWRHGTKRESMYDHDFIERYVDDGRLYGQFTQCGTDTGRSSSWQPNLQQLPRDMRYVIDGTHTGETIVAADYTAIEVCVAADLFGDEALLEAVKAEDIHSEVASMIFGESFDELDPEDDKRKEMRRLAKAGSFGLIFGGGFRSLHARARADGSTASYEDVERAGYRWLNRFHRVNAARTKAYAMSNQGRPVPIKYPTGLRRVLQPGVDLKGTTILNNSVQGTAAAGLKRALMLMDSRGLTEHLCAVVHDEIVSSVPDALAAEYSHELRKAMIEGMQTVTDATVRVELKVGKQWH